MVKKQIMARGVKDRGVLDAMKKVPRHLFAFESDLSAAYGDFPLSIGFNQTISQPYIVAYMTEALLLQGGERLLEIGTGSGYQTAVLAELADHVFTIEVIKDLSKTAEAKLRKMGYENLSFKVGNGRLGWPDEAPFDAIMVTAAPEVLPEGLVRQLKIGGRLVMPVGVGDQILMRYSRTLSGFSTESLLAVRFVPLR